MCFADSFSFKEIPFSLTEKCFPCRSACYSLYEMGCNLKKSQRRSVLRQLKQNHHPVSLLEFYEYAPTPSMQHLFVYLEGAPAPTPWFLLSYPLYKAIALSVYQSFSSGI